jgi:ribulose-phosphate 3-epimerase
MQIIPAILAKDEEEFRVKVARVRVLGLPVQIDVCDGEFVKNKTWAPPEMMKKLLGNIPFEAHLMVSNPEHLVPVWIAAGAAKVFYHAESTNVDGYILRSIDPEGRRLGIAINPDTPISRIVPLLEDIQEVLVMGVTPGWSGQGFQDISLEKIRAIRQVKPSARISVDGGVKPENVKSILDAGADVIIVGSALTDQLDPVEALKKIEEALK